MREQLAFHETTEALRRVRNSRAEKTGARRRGHPAPSGNSSVYSDAEYEMVEDDDIFTEAPWQQEQTSQTFFELEIRGYRLLQNARLSRVERLIVLAGTRNDTEYTAIVTSVTETEEARALERAVRFILPKPTQDGLLNSAHSTSGDAAEFGATWSFDPDESIWPSILEPDVSRMCATGRGTDS